MSTAVVPSPFSACPCAQESAPISTVSHSTQYGHVQTICRLALGIFAARTAPCLFLPALAVGVTFSLLARVWKALPTLQDSLGRPVCAQGFSELLSGKRLQEVGNLMLTTAFVAAHIRHDPHFFVPFSGLFLGIWLGGLKV